MPVVLDGDAGERVLIYGADGSTLRSIAVDANARLEAVLRAGSGAAPTNNVYSNNAVAPHVLTQRWTYTVAAGKVAVLQSMVDLIRRAGATATPGLCQAYIAYTPFGGAEVELISVMTFGGVVNDGDGASWSGQLTMLAGDRIRGLSEDQSTGGTFAMRIGGTLLVFDD